MSHHTKLDEKLEGADNFRSWKYRISLVLEENELDTYISGEVPVQREMRLNPYTRRIWSRPGGLLLILSRITLYHKCLP